MGVLGYAGVWLLVEETRFNNYKLSDGRVIGWSTGFSDMPEILLAIGRDKKEMRQKVGDLAVEYYHRHEDFHEKKRIDQWTMHKKFVRQTQLAKLFGFIGFIAGFLLGMLIFI
jgi:hypothetical protein